MKFSGKLVHGYEGFVGSKKKKNLVKLKELDKFGTFFKKVTHFLFFVYYVLVKNSYFPKDI